MAKDEILINRAPVLTLWAAVVAERLGFDREAALTMGKAVAGLNAQAKGRRLGIFKPAAAHGEAKKKRKLGEEFRVEVCGRPVPAKNTDAGVRAVVGDKPIDPAGVETYLRSKFGEDLGRVREAMRDLAGSMPPGELEAQGFQLYEQFRPDIPEGVRGWGARGKLSLEAIRLLRR